MNKHHVINTVLVGMDAVILGLNLNEWLTVLSIVALIGQFIYWAVSVIIRWRKSSLEDGVITDEERRALIDELSEEGKKLKDEIDHQLEKGDKNGNSKTE